MLHRALTLDAQEPHSFFLWGPRQTGKSTLLKQAFPKATWIDLLQSEVYRRYLANPERLRQEILAQPLAVTEDAPWVIIDEIQKLPALLDEVHWLIENRKIRFGLSGSSARKVRRGHANLLGGRATRHQLYGLSAIELGAQLNWSSLLNHGYLPQLYLAQTAEPLLEAYVADYLKEEIAAEGLTRNLPSFSEFLNVASLSDTELVNFSTMARDCGVSHQTIKNYFEILVDTLIGQWLPAYRRRPKRRVIQSPKFYFFDVGVVNFLAKRGRLAPGSELFGKAFENWVFHELMTYNAYRQRYADFFYWRLPSGIEVDFLVNHIDCAIESKATRHVTRDHLNGLRQLNEDHPEVKARYVVSLEPHVRKLEDGIMILPAEEFVVRLWQGELF